MNTQITEYSKTEAALSDLRTRYSGVVYEVSATKGMNDAKTARAELRNLRVDLEKKRKEIKEGNMVHSFGFAGYRGEAVGGLEYGVRYDGAIVRLSGFSAQRWWKSFGALATNCSRIDLQQTMVHDEDWTETTARHWEEMLEWYRERKRRPKPTNYTGPSGIESIYSGERVSDIYMRLYHRGSKKGLEKAMGHVRYEVELKDVKSWLMLRTLLASGSVESELASRVAGYFEARGCRLMWKNLPLQRLRCPAKTNDVDRRLMWIRRSVSPAVQELIELGHRAQVLDALGLSSMPYADTVTTNRGE